MPSNPKLYIKGQVRFLTISLQRGLPFLPNHLLKGIILSYLAKAVRLFPVTICDFIVMNNHIHFIIIIKEPIHLAEFLNHFKTNTALAINKLTNIKKGSVWEKGSDSPVILDLYALIKKVAYIYNNPSKANIVSSIDEYPNLNSFKFFKNNSGKGFFRCFHFSRTDIPRVEMEKEALPNYYKNLFLKTINKKKAFYKLETNSYLAFKALSHTDKNITFETYQKLVLELIQKQEKDFFKKRNDEKKSLLGVKALKSQSIFYEYLPHRRNSHKMICISSDVEIRIDYILRFKELVKSARESYKNWRLKNNLQNFPPGFFLAWRPPLESRCAL